MGGRESQHLIVPGHTPPRGQTEFQVNLNLGLTPCPPDPMPTLNLGLTPCPPDPMPTSHAPLWANRSLEGFDPAREA